MTAFVSSRISFPFTSFFLLLIVSQYSLAQPNFYQVCMNIGNYTANSTYHSNLKTLLTTLTSNTKIDYGFYNSSYGSNTDTAYAIGLCRGDANTNDCRNCLNDSTTLLLQNCPNQKEAIRWIENDNNNNDNCMLRYSNRSIFNLMETSPYIHMCNPNNASTVDEYNEVLSKLLSELRYRASGGDARKKYATGYARAPNFQDIFGLMQCTPDLDRLKCDQCLARAIGDLPTSCDDKIGGRVIGPSCSVRYENFRFYAEEAAPPSPSTNNTSPGGESNTSKTAIAIAIPIAVVVLVLCFLCIYLWVKKRENFRKDDDEIKTSESLEFNFDTIRIATNDFSDSNKLGEGGFGAVYWGRLSNGQVIAVKRLSMNSRQGDLEFKNEVLLVAKLQHRNLVQLLGFCLEGIERLLVYEFVPNKSLNYFIFDPTKKAQLDWEKRYKIIGGIARGLLYLHEDSRLRIIHHDLKASNILLDEEMNPKISDFGMARLIVVDQTQGNTSRVVGTHGYMAPEYVMHGQFSVKLDVFSFGVLVLEIVSGQKNRGFSHGTNVENLLSFVWRNWREGTAQNIIDPSLNNSSRNEILRCIQIGLLCVQENLVNRPTMATILLMLNSYSLTLPIPSEPAFFVDGRTESLPNMQSWEDNSGATRSNEPARGSARESVNEASITEPHPR